MKALFLSVSLILLSSTLSKLSASELDSSPVQFCDGLEEWPPFLFLERDQQGRKTTKITGASMDILEVLFQELDTSFSMKLMPWKRCTTAVQNFNADNQIEAFTNASFNAKRDEDYWVTDAIYQTQQGLFYSTARYPDTSSEFLLNNLNTLTLCNVHGYSHEIYYTRLGVDKDKKVLSSAKTPQAVLKMISLGRCDVFVNSIEPILGAHSLDQNSLPEDVWYFPLKDIPQSTFHIYISRKSPGGEALRNRLNDVIRIKKEEGALQTMLNAYFE